MENPSLSYKVIRPLIWNTKRKTQLTNKRNVTEDYS